MNQKIPPWSDITGGDTPSAKCLAQIGPVPIPQDGAPVFDSVNRWLIFVAEKTMVYGRYNELVHGDYNILFHGL